MAPRDALREPAPSAWPEGEVSTGWEYPWVPLHGDPDNRVPQQWAEPPQWPPPSPFRSLAAIFLLVVLVAAIGGAVTLAVQRLTGGVTPSGVDAAIVDVNTALGDGNAAAGTGMILSSSGRVLTNNHVVEGAVSIAVQIGGTGSVYTASVVGADPGNDVAVLQLANASRLPTIPLGDSEKVSVGDAVTVLGNALGRGGPPEASHGNITALGQTITAADPGGTNAETLSNMIQFDAQIQPGDSGGPLLNSGGRVIGMDTAGSSRVRFRQLGSNVGFAIPINDAVAIARQIASGQAAPNIVSGHRGLIGVEVQSNGTPPGARVIGVQHGSPAESAGIAAPDVIVSIDGKPVNSVASLRSALAHHQPGDRVSVGWIDASGRQHTAAVQLATGPAP